MPPVSLDEIYQARERLAGVAIRTPLHRLVSTSLPPGSELWLKAENLQRTGSFKIRGAYNAMAGLNEPERACGVTTYSSGNHGQAVAYAASLLGIRAAIVMPEDAMPGKVEATRRWGAAVIFAGHTSLDRQERALDLVRRHGYTMIPPFDDRRIIAGQGTAGLEMLEQFPGVRAVVAPVGGGGLISGIATAIKARCPTVRVIGVEPEGAADARDSKVAGRPVTWDRIDTVADGLRTSRVGELNFATIRECVDDIVTVTDNEILRAVGILAMEAKLVVEPSGAVTAAAVLFCRVDPADGPIVAVISGGNIEPARLQACLAMVSQLEQTLV